MRGHQRCSAEKSLEKKWSADHIRFITITFEKPGPDSGGQLIIEGFIKRMQDMRGRKIRWVFPLYNIAMDDLPGHLARSPQDTGRFASSREVTYRTGLRIMGLNDDDRVFLPFKDFFKKIFVDRKVPE